MKAKPLAARSADGFAVCGKAKMSAVAAIPRASSLVSNLAAERRPAFSSNIRSFGLSIALVPSERLSCMLSGRLC